jgi:hypothetical protein
MTSNVGTKVAKEFAGIGFSSKIKKIIKMMK